MLRAYARYTDVAITGTRGMTKTYTKMISEMMNGVAWPGTQVIYTGPSLKQLASIGGKTFHAIEHDYGALAKHWRVTAESKDDFKIETDYGSAFYIGESAAITCTRLPQRSSRRKNSPPLILTNTLPLCCRQYVCGTM